MQRYRYIDSLRGIAILSVLFIHSAVQGNLTPFPAFFKEVINAGQYGVQLFYVTSAFTLFLSLKNRNQFHKESAVFFFVRRFFRIAPMYYAGIIYYSFDRYIGLPFFINGTIREMPLLDALLSNIFFVHNFNPYWNDGIVPGGWSIACEMLFYLLVPLLFSRIKTLGSAIKFLIVSLLLSLVFHLLLANNPYYNSQYFIYCSLFNQLPVFALGIIGFFIITTGKQPVEKISLLMLIIVAIIYSFVGHVLFLMFSVTFLMLLWLLSKREYTLFVNGITVYLGRVSYSMYVIHFAVVFWFDKLGVVDILKVDSTLLAYASLLIRYVLVVMITAVVSTITYRVIELPFQRFGSNLISRMKNKRLTTF